MSQPKNILNVDGTIFEFPEHWRVSIFDEWEQFKRPASELHLKGCDIVAFDGETLWLIEVKDYTYLDASIPKDLTQIVGQKAAGTMALLYALERREAESHAVEFARACSQTTRINLVLHIEVKDGGRKEYVPTLLAPFKNKLSSVGRSLGLAKSLISSSAVSSSNIRWDARRDPQTRVLHSDRR